MAHTRPLSWQLLLGRKWEGKRAVDQMVFFLSHACSTKLQVATMPLDKVKASFVVFENLRPRLNDGVQSKKQKKRCFQIINKKEKCKEKLLLPSLRVKSDVLM